MKPITLEQAKNLEYRDMLYDLTLKNADGSPMRWRVNGKPKTWKRNPERVKVPIKYGLRGFDYLDENNLGYFSLTKE